MEIFLHIVVTSSYATHGYLSNNLYTLEIQQSH